MGHQTRHDPTRASSTRVHEWRQLTIGECIAFSRYAEGYMGRKGGITAVELLDILDDMGVCTTCGWTAELHTWSGDECRAVRICSTYAPRYAQGDSPA